MLKDSFRQYWDGQIVNRTTLEALGNPAVRAAWGISGEQWRQIRDQQDTALASARHIHIDFTLDDEISIRSMSMSEMAMFTDEMVLPDVWENVEGFEVTDPLELEFRREIDVTVMERLEEMRERGNTIQSSLINNAIADAINYNLTSEQRQKIQESLLANLGAMPIISLNMFEALDLTDAQREQMEQIKKELEPEFEKTLDKWVNGELALDKRIKEEAFKQRDGILIVDNTLRRKLVAEDPKLKEAFAEIQSQGRTFSTRFKIAMFDVLTDEQWFRLQDLIDNPPEHALVFRKMLKKLAGESEKDESETSESSDVWVPGPISWRPGDAIPEAYRIERNTRRQFPRGEE